MKELRRASRLSRRTFVARLGAAMVGLTALGTAGCQSTAPVLLPSPTRPAGQASMPSTTASTPVPPTAQPVAVATAAAQLPTATIKASGRADLAVIRGTSPADLTRAAIEAIGGIGRFVPNGSNVVVKPNICVSSTPEYAATTNPEVVETIVRLCKEASARSVKVLDYGFAGQRTSYAQSGIEAAVKRAGGEMVPITPLKWKKVANPNAKEAKSLEIYEDVLAADVLINVPIAKHHNLAGLTLGMKNLMGTVQYREPFHGSLGQRLVDLHLLVKPAFTLVDAVRILTRNGPQGGNLADVKRMDTVIASTDIVAVDAFASTLFGLKPDELETVRAGQKNGLGTYNLASLKIAEVAR